MPRREALEGLEQRWLLSGGGQESIGCGCGTCLAAAGRSPVEPPPTEMPLAQTAAPVVHRLTDAHAIWKPLQGLPAARGRQTFLTLDSYAPFTIDQRQLTGMLSRAPQEVTAAGRNSPLVFAMPAPDGVMQRFAVVETQVMAPELAARFPQIRTYVARGIDDPTAVARLDTNPFTGFHAMVLSASGQWAIDNYFHNDSSTFVSYFKRDLERTDGFVCLTENAEPLDVPEAAGGPENIPAGDVLRTFRVAITTTTAYNSFHGNTIASVLSAVTTAINRITGIYERDLSTRLQLVANTTLLFSGLDGNGNIGTGSVSTLANNNQSFTDTRIGVANYDVGHVFHNGSNNGVSAGGIGIVGSAAKARACSQTSPPSGDLFAVDYVAHEMGHQFNGRHNFSNCSGPGDSASIANEPGSGSTIMGYAGLCGSNNLQSNSDAMFNHINYNQMYPYIRNTISSVGTTTPTGNSPPAVSAGPNYVIPTRTPYELVAVGSDPNNDPLVYSWEGVDTGGSLPVNNTTGTTGPIVRPFLPTSSPSRAIPRLTNLVNNTTVTGEVLTTVARTMNFRVVVRDNLGGVNFSDMSVTTVNVGTSGFTVTSPNTTGLSFQGNSNLNVTWSVVSTNVAPINATHVNIRLSTDGGFTYPILLASNVPNTGSATVTLPNIATTAARVRVQPVNNIFFDISNFNFTITASSLGAPPAPQLAAGSDTGVSNTDRIINLTTPTFIGTAPAGALVRVLANGVEVATATADGSGNWQATSSPLVDGPHTITVTASLGGETSPPSEPLQIVVDTVAPTLVSSGFLFETTHRPILTFSENVAGGIDAGRLEIVNLTTSTTLNPAEYQVEFELATFTAGVAFVAAPGGIVPDGNYRITLTPLVTDVAGNPLAGNNIVDFFVLTGDANRDRSVDLGDFGILASRFNQPGTFSQGDFNYSGEADLADFALLATNFNTSLPAPSGLPRALIVPAGVFLGNSAGLVRERSIEELFGDPV
ncbi:MAG: Ig-like domain-containing protein [Phycisphaerales bacterium]|nr:Ig-like domain-containing protein [Phycisphaerales bacterium]